MKISYNWLKNYASPVPAPEVISELLTDCGLEVEGMEYFQSVKGGLEGVVIGEVKTCEPHPGSDHLVLTTVEVGGKEPLRIVCGAPNVAAGQKVPVALIGTTLYLKEKEITLQKTKIRGELSEGMICAEDELGLGDSHSGIMVLDPSAVPGTPAKEYFKIEEDVIFEIGLTPNRVDASSHIGVARDLVALLQTQDHHQQLKSHLILPDVSGFKEGTHQRKFSVVIEDPEACPRYSGLFITGISVKESPDWLKNRLNAIGLRPINNIVDCTNFVLHETGQPLHAFDADQVSGDKVIIKKEKPGTKFVTLDGITRELTGEDLMICNAHEPMCIGGVFGGERSGVSSSTTSIFLESACFSPKTIRKTARYHGLQTDASFRFERGSDIGITTYALKRAALLICEITGGKISSPVIDEYPVKRQNPVVTLSFSNLDRLVGKKIDRHKVKNILEALEIKILEKNETLLKLEIPFFKVDVLREVDVIEEILRIYGYNNVETGSHINGTMTHKRHPDPDQLQDLISDFLSNNGFFEIMNNSLTASSWYTGNPVFPVENAVRLLNPLSRDLDVMRQSLLYGALESISYNQNRKNPDIRFFEFGNCYSLQSTHHNREKNSNPLDSILESKHLALFLSGKKYYENWNADDSKFTFFDLKNLVNQILQKAGCELSVPEITSISTGLFSEGLAYRIGREDLVSFGVLSDALRKQFDCHSLIFYADFHWDVLIRSVRNHSFTVQELPKFPEVRRDLALLIDQSVTFAEIEQLAFQTEKALLKKVGLFDVYEGEKIEAGKKSYAVFFILQDNMKTLTDKEIDKTMNKLIRSFEERLHAQLR